MLTLEQRFTDVLCRCGHMHLIGTTGMVGDCAAWPDCHCSTHVDGRNLCPVCRGQKLCPSCNGSGLKELIG